MNGNWIVQIEDGTHVIHASITIGIMVSMLKITWDDEEFDPSPVWGLDGNLKYFKRNGHYFLLSGRCVRQMRSFVLYMDDIEVPHGGVATLVERATAQEPIQFIKELSVQDSEEVVATEVYPLDNSFGDQLFTTVRQVSRESTNELSVDAGSQLGGKVSLTVLSAIKAEIEAQVSQQTGQRIGEKVTESQTLTFSVGPKSSVIYQVVWKRKVRSGERLYLSGGNHVTVPYRINYGLSCEVRTQAHTATC